MTFPLPRRLREIASRVRTRRAPLNIAQIADDFEVRVLAHSFRGRVTAAAIGGTTITLDPRLQGFERRWAFAHELGHILAQRRVVDVPPHEEEWMADTFAAELLCPQYWVFSPSPTHSSLARTIGVREWVVGLQLLTAEENFAIVRDHDRVLCAACGARQHAADCLCGVWRRRPRADRAELPCLAELPDWNISARGACSGTQLDLLAASFRTAQVPEITER